MGWGLVFLHWTKDGASQQVGQDKGSGLAKAWEEIALDGPQPVGVFEVWTRGGRPSTAFPIITQNQTNEEQQRTQGNGHNPRDRETPGQTPRPRHTGLDLTNTGRSWKSGPCSAGPSDHKFLSCR